VARFRQRDYRAAVDDFTKAVDLDPSVYSTLWWRGQSYFGLKEIEKGVADLVKATQLGQTVSRDDQRAVLLAATGDTTAYRRECERILAGVDEGDDANSLNNAAWACIYLSNSNVDFSRVLTLAEKAVALRKDYVHLNTLGAALYRNGRFAECLKTLEEGMKLHGHAGIAWDWAFVAMANHRLGRPEEAKRWLDKSRDWIQQIDAGKIRDSYVGESMNWNHRLELYLLMREAEALINHPTGSKP
jgi:tetratricopeptide (TPR) repeat protein